MAGKPLPGLLPVLKSRAFRLIVVLVIGGLSLYLALRSLTLTDVWAVLSRADLRYVGFAALSVGANTLGKAYRWQILMGKPGQGVRFSYVLMSLLAGQSLNTVYPARAGDLSRMVTVGSLGPGKAFVLGTVLVEKVLDSLAYAFLFLFLLVLMPLPSWVSSSGYTFAGLTLAVSIAVFVVAWQRARVARLVERAAITLPMGAGPYVNGRLRSVLDSLSALERRQDLVSLALLSALVWGTAVLNNHLVLVAVGLRLPLTASLLLLIALQAGISLVPVPGRIGIFEYICVLALGSFGVSQAEAFGYGLLFHWVVLMPWTLLGVVCFALLGAARPHGSLNPASLAGSDEQVGEESSFIQGRGR